MNLSSNLKALLKKLCLTQAELGRRAEVSPQKINEWISGRSPRDLAALHRVCKVLKVSLEEICFGKISVAQHIDQQQEPEWSSGIYEVKYRKLT